MGVQRLKTFPKDSALEVHPSNMAAYITALRLEMRRCLQASEAARDKFYAVVNQLKGDGFTGVELDLKVKDNMYANAAISDSRLYDRWVTKYANMIQAEIAAHKFLTAADEGETRERP